MFVCAPTYLGRREDVGRCFLDKSVAEHPRRAGPLDPGIGSILPATRSVLPHGDVRPFRLDFRAGMSEGLMALCPPQSTAKDEIPVSKLYRPERL